MTNPNENAKDTREKRKPVFVLVNRRYPLAQVNASLDKR
jgi:hypothetical protein